MRVIAQVSGPGLEHPEDAHLPADEPRVASELLNGLGSGTEEQSVEAPLVTASQPTQRLRQGGGRWRIPLEAPMPGLIVSVPVSEGQRVEKGEVLVILESMKMQNELKAPRSGTVTRIRVKPGESVEQKQTLLSVV